MSFYFSSAFTLSILILLLRSDSVASDGKSLRANGLINVRSKFSGQNRSLDVLIEHDSRRQMQIFFGVDISLGGTGRPDSVGLYFAKIGIGMPSKDYYMQVDTGSDIIWINCIKCHGCPKKGSFGIKLTQYDVNSSSTGRPVSCSEDICREINDGPLDGCTENATCPYSEIYGDGSYTAGYLVQDVVQFDGVSGDLMTMSTNKSIVFGCGAKQSGNADSKDESLDGILGFGKSNTSMISQIASSGNVKKMFAHCLDSVNGGGIFAIGHIVHPEVNMTALITNTKPLIFVAQFTQVPDNLKAFSGNPDWYQSLDDQLQILNQNHTLNYNVHMKAVQVGNRFINLPPYWKSQSEKGTIIDSGTTLAYLPKVIYEPLIREIISQQLDLEVEIVHDQYSCFKFSESLDDAFPPVTFHFENSLFFKVYPHQYLFPFDDLWCIGWQNSGKQSRNAENLTLLGDLVLSNKLVIYDLENQVIGWTEYNCSTTIGVKDEETGEIHMVGPHVVSSCERRHVNTPLVALIWLLLLLSYSYVFYI